MLSEYLKVKFESLIFIFYSFYYIVYYVKSHKYNIYLCNHNLAIDRGDCKLILNVLRDRESSALIEPNRMSPILFNQYREWLVKQALAKLIKFGDLKKILVRIYS